MPEMNWYPNVNIYCFFNSHSDLKVFYKINRHIKYSQINSANIKQLHLKFFCNYKICNYQIINHFNPLRSEDGLILISIILAFYFDFLNVHTVNI